MKTNNLFIGLLVAAILCGLFLFVLCMYEVGWCALTIGLAVFLGLLLVALYINV